MCPGILEVKKVLSLSKGSSTLEPPLVSQHPIQTLVDEVVKSMQFFRDPTLPLESYGIKVVELMKYSINPTLPLEINVSVDHVLFNAS
jgi:hypothetical protein